MAESYLPTGFSDANAGWGGEKCLPGNPLCLLHTCCTGGIFWNIVLLQYFGKLKDQVQETLYKLPNTVLLEYDLCIFLKEQRREECFSIHFKYYTTVPKALSAHHKAIECFCCVLTACAF